MGRSRDPNRRNHQGWMLSDTVQTRLGSLICLAALLALTFLPLVHQYYVHGLEELHGPHAAGVDHIIGLRLNAPEPYEPHHSHHDAATCLICQAASLSRYFSAPTLSLSPISALPVQRFWDRAFTSIIADVNILTAGPRAPPASL
jgi:hypothetical protein